LGAFVKNPSHREKLKAAQDNRYRPALKIIGRGKKPNGTVKSTPYPNKSVASDTLFLNVMNSAITEKMMAIQNRGGAVGGGFVRFG